MLEIYHSRALCLHTQQSEDQRNAEHAAHLLYGAVKSTSNRIASRGKAICSRRSDSGQLQPQLRIAKEETPICRTMLVEHITSSAVTDPITI
jgi:hypothetical protein